ncbi:DUF2878 domain-containing protein [Salinispirillum sp. LH 10-3-1]|uniref:DUF2878 domain-containing protein n=1 Tax=Salinispirillum sp. LH 10-3-1 TaxID=2952525 RepID=A0AB38YKV1_9GAMM
MIKPWMHGVIYQATFFITVMLGNIWALAWSALLLFTVVFKQPKPVLAFIALVTVGGYCVDLLIQAAGLIQFTGNTLLGPIWLFVLWIGFANVIWHLAWRIPMLWLQILLGAVSGPLSYFGGAKLGAAEPMDTAGIIAYSLWWAFAFPAGIALRHAWQKRFLDDPSSAPTSD